MKAAIYFSAILLITYCNVHPHLDPIITHAPKAYQVNLEDSPEVRWAPILKDYA